jgi:hypothetical protein
MTKFSFVRIGFDSVASELSSRNIAGKRSLFGPLTPKIAVAAD